MEPSKKTQQLTVKIREAIAEDAAFIFNSWLKSNRQTEPWVNTDNNIYFSEHHKLIERLLKRCKTIIACDPNDPATIFGYICFERVEGVLVLHYVYTKHTFRGLGIAKELLKETQHDFEGQTAVFTHYTKAAKKLYSKLNLVFHPYILINYLKGE